MHEMNSITLHFSGKILDQFGGGFSRFWTFPLYSCKKFQNHSRFLSHEYLGEKRTSKNMKFFMKLEAWKNYYLSLLWGYFQSNFKLNSLKIKR